MNVKIIRKLPANAKHTCFILDSSAKSIEFKELSPFDSYIKQKLKEKKNQLIRLIQKDQHLVVVIFKRDKKDPANNHLEDLRRLGNQIVQKFNAERASDVVFRNSMTGLASGEYLALLEGALLGNYSFDKYKKTKSVRTLRNIQLFENSPKTQELREMANVVESNFVARDLINEPVINLNSVKLGKEVQRLGKKSGFSVKILNKAQITKLKMGGLLGVNRGSVDPPIFGILEWKPAKPKNKRPYVLVGKGVVYDTGGYNIKVGNNMPTMKCDMGGSAAVIGTVDAISKNKLPLHVVGLIPITDNRIGGNALVPDDVITMMDGTTVEVLNTDAEGRLILADALAYAKRYNPKLVIDLATLTGSAAAITGSYGSAMMGNADDNTKTELKASGDHVYERLAELPFWKEYEGLLKSNVADLKNIGGPTGGAITAGKFLEHFTDYPWIHLDIAGPAFIDSADGYRHAGGTGTGVRLLYNFLKSKA